MALGVPKPELEVLASGLLLLLLLLRLSPLFLLLLVRNRSLRKNSRETMLAPSAAPLRSSSKPLSLLVLIFCDATSMQFMQVLRR